LTPEQRGRALALAAGGASERAIASELGVTRRVVATALRQAGDDLEPVVDAPAPAAPLDLPELPDLEPPMARRPVTADQPPPALADQPLTSKERDRAATAARIAESKAKLEAEGARDNMRDPNPLRDAMRSARWRRPI